MEIRGWGRKKLRILRRLLAFTPGIPAHERLNDVMNAPCVREVVRRAVFPKFSQPGSRACARTRLILSPPAARPRGACAAGGPRSGADPPLHMVSAWASRQRLGLGQEATDAESNEISAIPILLQRLHLTGALVTIDAMGSQSKIAQTILQRTAGYDHGDGGLLALKDNQRSLAEEVALCFDSPELKANGAQPARA